MTSCFQLLSDDAWICILSYFDPIDLCRMEMTCTFFRHHIQQPQNANTLWKPLEDQLLGNGAIHPHLLAVTSSSRQRVVYYTRTQRYAQQIEQQQPPQLLLNNHNNNNPRPCHQMDMKPFHYPSEYDFFIRLAQVYGDNNNNNNYYNSNTNRGDGTTTVIWQGFLPNVTDFGSLGIRILVPPIADQIRTSSSSWYCYMDKILNFTVHDLLNETTSLTHSAFLDFCFGNLTLTVLACPKQQQQQSLSQHPLVVVSCAHGGSLSHGYNTVLGRQTFEMKSQPFFVSPNDDSNHTLYFLRPRFTATLAKESNNNNDDEDTDTTNTSGNHEHSSSGRLLSIELFPIPTTLRQPLLPTMS